LWEEKNLSTNIDVEKVRQIIRNSLKEIRIKEKAGKSRSDIVQELVRIIERVVKNAD
jgi:histone H3/H4